MKEEQRVAAEQMRKESAEKEANSKKQMEEMQANWKKEQAEKDRIQDLKLQGIYGVAKFNTISGRGDIYPCVCVTGPN